MCSFVFARGYPATAFTPRFGFRRKCVEAPSAVFADECRGGRSSLALLTFVVHMVHTWMRGVASIYSIATLYFLFACLLYDAFVWHEVCMSSAAYYLQKGAEYMDILGIGFG